MQDYERNLFISLCLGIELTGLESPAELMLLLEDVTAAAQQQQPNSLQQDIADWLKISIDGSENRQDASVRLWNRIENRGYSMVDVPASIRRTAFAGDLNPQKREYQRGWPQRLKESLRSMAVGVVVIVALIFGLWLLAKKFLP